VTLAVTTCAPSLSVALTLAPLPSTPLRFELHWIWLVMVPSKPPVAVPLNVRSAPPAPTRRRRAP
jgi:hypothetical protein